MTITMMVGHSLGMGTIAMVPMATIWPPQGHRSCGRRINPSCTCYLCQLPGRAAAGAQLPGRGWLPGRAAAVTSGQPGSI